MIHLVFIYSYLLEEELNKKEFKEENRMVSNRLNSHCVICKMFSASHPMVIITFGLMHKIFSLVHNLFGFCVLLQCAHNNFFRYSLPHFIFIIGWFLFYFGFVLYFFFFFAFILWKNVRLFISI